MRKNVTARIGLGILLVLAVVGVSALANVKDAQCSWCAPLVCFGSADCGANCFCAIPMGEVQGRCVGAP